MIIEIDGVETLDRQRLEKCSLYIIILSLGCGNLYFQEQFPGAKSTWHTIYRIMLWQSDSIDTEVRAKNNVSILKMEYSNLKGISLDNKARSKSQAIFHTCYETSPIHAKCIYWYRFWMFSHLSVAKVSFSFSIFPYRSIPCC